ncbi:MAG: ABC transporter ATP-binding protein [Rhizobacter sp.]|nr:ABC transporter ATP-binding protein [Rhizobacter sp.]
MADALNRPPTALATLRSLLELLADSADPRLRCQLAAILVLAASGSVLAGLAPLALQHLVDALRLSQVDDGSAASTAHSSDPSPMLWLGAAYLLALAVGRVLAELRLFLAGLTEQRLHARLSRRYLAHLLELPLAFHTGRSTGALANGLVQAAAGCQMGLNSLLQCLPVLVELLTVLLVLAQLGQPALVGIFALSALAYGLIFARGARRARIHGKSVSQAGLQLHGELADKLLNIETIKCFGAAPRARTRFDEASRLLEGRWARLHAQRARTGLLVAAAFTTSVGSSLFIAGQATASGSLTMGGFVLVTVCMLQMVRPLELLGSAIRDLAQSLEFTGPLLEVMRMQPETAVQPPATGSATADAPPPHLTNDGPPDLLFRAVHLDLGRGEPALRGLDLHVPAGSTMAIVGHSGAGKSSLARLLPRLHEATSGTILWNGWPIQRMALDRLRQSVAVVAQDTTLFSDSIAANIGIGRLDASREEIEGAARQAQIHAFIASLPDGYDTQVGERGLRLSGGERQRIAIARAILVRP